MGTFPSLRHGNGMSAMTHATPPAQPAEPVRVDAERAVALADEAMAAACSGWRRDRRCVDQSGDRLAHPHPLCLHARYRYLLTLLQHGLPVDATSRN